LPSTRHSRSTAAAGRMAGSIMHGRITLEGSWSDGLEGELRPPNLLRQEFESKQKQRAGILGVIPRAGS
jgi:hypothetical protein